MNKRKVIMTSEEIIELSQNFVRKEKAYRKAKRFNDALSRLKEMLDGCSCDMRTGEITMYEGTIGAIKELYDAAIWDGEKTW